MGALHADIVALAEAFEAEKAGIAAEAEACVRAAQESAARSERWEGACAWVACLYGGHGMQKDQPS